MLIQPASASRVTRVRNPLRPVCDWSAQPKYSPTYPQTGPGGGASAKWAASGPLQSRAPYAWHFVYLPPTATGATGMRCVGASSRHPTNRRPVFQCAKAHFQPSADPIAIFAFATSALHRFFTTSIPIYYTTSKNTFLFTSSSSSSSSSSSFSS